MQILYTSKVLAPFNAPSLMNSGSIDRVLGIGHLFDSSVLPPTPYWRVAGPPPRWDQLCHYDSLLPICNPPTSGVETENPLNSLLLVVNLSSGLPRLGLSASHSVLTPKSLLRDFFIRKEFFPMLRKSSFQCQSQLALPQRFHAAEDPDTICLSSLGLSHSNARELGQKHTSSQRESKIRLILISLNSHLNLITPYCPTYLLKFNHDNYSSPKMPSGQYILKKTS